MIFLNLLFVLLVLIICIYVSKKYNFLINLTGDIHQKYSTSERVPLLGGIIIYLGLILNYEINQLYIYLFIFLFFLLGIFSDLNKISSPIIRFLIQIILLLIFLNILNINIGPIRVSIVDVFLNNYLFNIFFTSFCILIIVNGTNFIDGMNNLVLGYFLIIAVVLKNMSLNGYELPLLIDLNLFIYILIILFIFNFLNKIYLGDSGAYLIGLIFSIFLIDFYNLNSPRISPFFIVLLLWYPAFENLFSIIRKINFKRSPIKPDTLHLHQLIFKFLKIKLNKKNKFINSLTGNLINCFNLLIIMCALQKTYSSSFQIILILLSIIVYVFFYVRLINYKN
tara:strand:+ start:4472 stop:5485 length:1014 start_codon:yes stop_codon:yes gene_type:complete